MQEIWKVIPSYETRYEASNLGRIRSIRRGVVIGQRIGPNGYRSIRLSIGSKRKYHDVHRLIAKTFLENLVIVYLLFRMQLKRIMEGPE